MKARAHGQWESILAALAPQLAPAIARLPHHVPCPVHGGKDGFRLHRDAAETGGGICNTCPNPRTGDPKDGFPDGFDVLQWANGWEFRQALEAVAGYLGMAPDAPSVTRKAPRATTAPIRTPEPREWARRALLRVWSEESLAADDPQADPMWRYLDRRGVLMPSLPRVLRFHPALPYHHEIAPGESVIIGTYPAMLALVVNIEGKPVSVHRTFLTPDGRKAAPEWEGETLDARKMMSPVIEGTTNGAAIRLFEAGPLLVVAEGIETALSVHLDSGAPVWSAMNAGGLERLEIPGIVRELVIAADHDLNGRGQDAARILARRCQRMGISVRIALPPVPGADWNDVLGKAARDDG